MKVPLLRKLFFVYGEKIGHRESCLLDWGAEKNKKTLDFVKAFLILCSTDLGRRRGFSRAMSSNHNTSLFLPVVFLSNS